VRGITYYGWWHDKPNKYTAKKEIETEIGQDTDCETDQALINSSIALIQEADV